MASIGDLPATTTPTGTLDALASGGAVRWWQTTTIVEVHGPDALTLLDGLCTQAVERIEPGTGRLGLFLDAKAKIIAPAMLWRAPDADWHDPKRDEVVAAAPRVLLEVPAGGADPLVAHLRRYRLRARTAVEPTELAIVAIAGVGALDALASIDVELPALATEDGDHPGMCVFIGTRSEVAALVRETLPAAGALLADPDAWEAARIDAGRAGLNELLPGRMPAEVGGMERAVALDAGCYLGQEPVARLHYRGHANRTLRRLVADEPIVPTPADDSTEARDAALELRPEGVQDGRPTGRLATWARHPDGRIVALATIRREIVEGSTLELPGGGGRLRVVDAIPED